MDYRGHCRCRQRAAHLQRRHGYAMGFSRQRQLHLGEAHDAAWAYTLPPVVEFAEMTSIVLRRRSGFLDFHRMEGSIHDD